MQVDLHIHSTASDGTWTPPEVVAAALAAGLGAIAVTCLLYTSDAADE